MNNKVVESGFNTDGSMEFRIVCAKCGKTGLFASTPDRATTKFGPHGCFEES